MEREHIDSIVTQAVRDVVWAYEEFYYLDRPELGTRAYRRARVCGCGPQTGEWPNNHIEMGGRTVPAICEACEWISKRRQLQTAITVSGLSMPIPLRTRAVVSPSKLASAPVHTHPLDVSDPYYWEPSKPLGSSSGDAAGSIARWLCEAEPDQYSKEHVVFYLHHSQAISLLYTHRDQEVRDVIQFSPVLVYWANRDGRANGWIRQLVAARDVGMTFVVEE